MSTIAHHITGVSMVFSTICSGADQRKHQSSASLAFGRGIHRWPVNIPHNGPVTRGMFPLDDVIMIASRIAEDSESNSFITGIYPDASARKYVLLSPPYKNYMYVCVCVCVCVCLRFCVFVCACSPLPQSGCHIGRLGYGRSHACWLESEFPSNCREGTGRRCVRWQDPLTTCWFGCTPLSNNISGSSLLLTAEATIKQRDLCDVGILISVRVNKQRSVDYFKTVIKYYPITRGQCLPLRQSIYNISYSKQSNGLANDLSN